MPNLFTSDIEAALGFYRDRLGFTPSFRFPPAGRPEHVVLELGGSRLALSTDRAITAAGLQPERGNPFELVVWCDDVDAEAERLGASGAAVVVAPYDHPAGHRRAYVSDPDGNWLALVDAR
jgi:lactoylglutathione lyase